MESVKKSLSISMIIDLVIVVTLFIIIYYVRYSASELSYSLSQMLYFYPEDVPFRYFTEYLQIFIFYIPLTILFLNSLGVYESRKTWSYKQDFYKIIKAVTFSSLLVNGYLFLTKFSTASRWLFLVNWGVSIFFLMGWRYLWRKGIREKEMHEGVYASNAIIIGKNKVGFKIKDFFANRRFGVNFVGFVDETMKKGVIGIVDKLDEIVTKYFINDIYITGAIERERLKEILLLAKKRGVSIHIVPDLFGLYMNPPDVYMIENIPIIEIKGKKRHTFQLAIKRLMDIFISSLMLLIFLPLLIIIAILIKLDSPGPIFYIADRKGMKGKVFKCYKFRSMVENATEMKEKLKEMNERDGPIFKISRDPRVTRLGRIIRKFHLDEIPQLINVFKGEMSITGPRPHPLEDVAKYEFEHISRMDFMPGMTGLWQIYGQDDSFEHAMELDMEYINNWSLMLDIKILLSTIPYVLRGKGK